MGLVYLGVSASPPKRLASNLASNLEQCGFESHRRDKNIFTIDNS